MSRNRRDRRKSRGQVFFITGRVRKGLPFVARESVKRVLLGILSRAQGFYPVQICAFVFMGNHYHIIITGQSVHISPFMNYVQGEIAKAMQKLIPGVYKGWFWEGRFKEQILVTAEDVIEKMGYIYLNPVRARLVNRVQEYPVLNSYSYLRRGKLSFLSKWIPSSQLSGLPERYNRKEDLKLTASFLKLSPSTELLTIDPFAWFPSLNEELNKEQVTERLLQWVAQEEDKLMSNPVLGVASLIAQTLRKEFTPGAKDYTPYLICCDSALRKLEILSYREFCQACREAWELLKRGLSYIWPNGAYRPSMRWRPLLVG